MMRTRSLALALVTALSLSAAPIGAADPTPSTHNQVVIVGAGAAGIYAAYELNRTGYDVLLLEALGRHGGRVEVAGPGFADFPIEECAEEVTGTNNFLFWDIMALDPARLVEDFTGPPDQDFLYSIGGTTVWLGDGVPQDIYDYWDFYYEIFSHTDDLDDPERDLQEFLENDWGVDSAHPAYHLYEILPASEWATSLNKLGLRSLANAASDYPYRNGVRILSNASYIDTLDELYTIEILDRIVYNSPVIKIDYSGEFPVAIDANGVHHYADIILVTVSLGVLQSETIEFVPSLPAEKVNAYNTLGMGHGIKMFLRFSNTFWNGDRMYYLFTEGPTQACWTPGKLRVGGTNNILTCYIMGDAADYMTSIGEEAAIDQALADIDALFAGTPAADSFEDAIVHNATEEPYTRGPYSYPAPGTFPLDGSRNMYDVLGDTVDDKLFFAGEATHDGGAVATVAGALDTGLRASGEIDSTMLGPERLDAFQCYDAKPSKGSPKLASQDVHLEDQFGEIEGTTKKIKQLCAPVDENEDWLANPEAHLTCYKLKDAKKSKKPKKWESREVLVTNWFGEDQSLTVKAPKSLCVPSTKEFADSGETPGDASDLGIDHYLCYDARQSRGAPKLQPLAVTLDDQFGEAERRIAKPKRLCTPVDKNFEGILDDETHLTCYEVRSLRGAEHIRNLKVDVLVNNQFGNDQAYEVKRPKTVCLPSTKEVVF